MKEPLVPIISKFLKELAISMKEPTKIKPMFFDFFIFFWRITVIYAKPVLNF